MANILGSIGKMSNSEGPGRQKLRRSENAFVAANVTSTVADAVAVAVDGTSVFVDETSNVGALSLVNLQMMMRVDVDGKIGLSLYLAKKGKKQ